MSIGFVQFLPMLILLIMFGLPMFFILPKAGFSRWWLLMIVVPMFGVVILLWILAFSKWSSRDATEVFS